MKCHCTNVTPSSGLKCKSVLSQNVLTLLSLPVVFLSAFVYRKSCFLLRFNVAYRTATLKKVQVMFLGLKDSFVLKANWTAETFYLGNIKKQTKKNIYLKSLIGEILWNTPQLPLKSLTLF